MSPHIWTMADETEYIAARKAGNLHSESQARRDAFLLASISAVQAFKESQLPVAPKPRTIDIIEKLSELNTLWDTAQKRYSDGYNNLAYIVEGAAGVLFVVTLTATMIYDAGLDNNLATHKWLPEPCEIILSEGAYATILSDMRVSAPSHRSKPHIKWGTDVYRKGLLDQISMAPGCRFWVLRGDITALDPDKGSIITVKKTTTT